MTAVNRTRKLRRAMGAPLRAQRTLRRVSMILAWGDDLHNPSSGAKPNRCCVDTVGRPFCPARCAVLTFGQRCPRGLRRNTKPPASAAAMIASPRIHGVLDEPTSVRDAGAA